MDVYHYDGMCLSIFGSQQSPAHMWILDDILASDCLRSEVLDDIWVSCRLKTIKFKNNTFVGRFDAAFSTIPKLLLSRYDTKSVRRNTSDKA